MLKMNDFDSSDANEPELNGAAQPAAAVRWSAASALLATVEIWSMSTSSPQAVPADTLDSTKALEPAGTSGQSSVPEGSQARRARPSQLLAEARFFSSSARRVQDPTAAPEPAETATDLLLEFRRRLEEASHA
jgi:hypothetical protein